ncbi:MAG: metalloregulator ArsR/SmtB family transcription factor [Bacteroidota bacterium]
MRRDVFQAIADPTRREIINMLSKENLNLNAVAEKFAISRPAISKHIKVLTECGVVTITQLGRDRICEVRLEKLQEVSSWVEQYRKDWDLKMDALDQYLSKVQKINKNVRKK